MAEVKITILGEDRASAAFQKVESAFDKLKQNWLTIAASMGAVYKAFDFAKLGADALQAEQSFKAVTHAYGVNADSLLLKMKQVSAGIIDDSALMQRAVKALQQGLSQTQIVQLLEVARSSARVAGTDVATAFDSITNAVANQTTRALKLYGLIIDQNKAFKDYADAIRKPVESLTELEKSQALTNAATAEGYRQMKAMGEITFNASEAFQMLTAKLHEIKEVIGKELIYTIRDLSQYWQLFAAGLAGIAIVNAPIIIAAITTAVSALSAALLANPIALFTVGIIAVAVASKSAYMELSGLNQELEAHKKLQTDLEKQRAKMMETPAWQKVQRDLPGITLEAFTEAFQAGEVFFNKEKDLWMKRTDYIQQQNEKVLGQWKSHYTTLQSIAETALDKIKQKQEEIPNIEKSMRQDKMTTEDLILGIRQKGMTEEEKYNSQVASLGEKYTMAMSLQGEEKISLLQNIQSAWASLTDEVKAGESVVVSAASAQATAITNIQTISAAIQAERSIALQAAKDEIASWKQIHDEAITVLDSLKNKIGEVDKALEPKKLEIDVSGALAAIGQVKDALSGARFGTDPFLRPEDRAMSTPISGPIPLATSTTNNRASTVNYAPTSNITINAPSGDPEAIAKAVTKTIELDARSGRNNIILRDGVWTNA